MVEGYGEEPLPNDLASGSASESPEAQVAKDGLEGVDAEHSRHCFVVMPFGRDAVEQRQFLGWYRVVIEPSIHEAGFAPVLAAAVEEPNAINDEIRAHLAFDPMVVVDLGGATPEEPPNPNVMYELGIRHAMDLPVVLMAWEGQSLPFDIGNQRALIGQRDLIDIDTTRQSLVRFIRAAGQGRFYRPMQAVRRIATVDYAADKFSENSLLGAVAEELRELRHVVTKPASRSSKRLKERSPKNFALAHTLDTDRKEALHGIYMRLGGSQKGWGQLMGMKASQAAGDPWGWAEPEWIVLFRTFIGDGERLDAVRREPKLNLDQLQIPES